MSSPFILSVGVALIVLLAGCSKETPPEAPRSGTLKLEASITFGDGDTKPVASTRFYVLNKSLRMLVSDFGPQRLGLEPNELNGHKICQAAFNLLSDQSSAGHAEFKKAFREKIVAEVETNMSGVAPGKNVALDRYPHYYIAGAANMRGNEVFWDHGQMFEPGTATSVYLNGKNALTR